MFKIDDSSQLRSGLQHAASIKHQRLSIDGYEKTVGAVWALRKAKWHQSTCQLRALIQAASSQRHKIHLIKF